MKTQKIKLSFIALLCTILLCLMLCACLTLMPNVAYATDAVAQLENHSYDSYTDTDTFTYEGKPYFIQQYNNNQTLKTGNILDMSVDIKVKGDNAIVQIVPKELFRTVGDHLHIGKEYGFFVHTEDYRPTVNKLSTVVIFDIINEFDLDSDAGVVKVTVEPIIQRNYVYLSKDKHEYYPRITQVNQAEYSLDYDITQDCVIPHFTYHASNTANKFDFEYEVDQYYLKDISYEMTLFNEQSSNNAMPDYNVQEDNGSYFTYFDYKYQGTVRKNGSFPTGETVDLGLACIDAIISMGKTFVKAVPGIGTVVTVADGLMSVVESTKTIGHFGAGMVNFLSTSDVSVNNGTITAKNFYANKNDQINKYGDIVRTASTIINTTEDGSSIWYKIGNKATGYFKISHSTPQYALPNQTRLIRQIGLKVVKKNDGDVVKADTSNYHYILRDPVAERLELNKDETLRLLDEGENYFSFSPQYSSDYKLTVGTGQNVQVFVNGTLINGTKNATTQTYVLPLAGGSNNIIKIKAVKEGCFANIKIDANDATSGIKINANNNYLVKIAGKATKMQTIGTSSASVFVRKAFTLNNNNILTVLDEIASNVNEKSIDIMCQNGKDVYLLLNSAQTQTISITQKDVPVLSTSAGSDLTLTSNGYYRYVKVNLENDKTYYLTIKNKNGQVLSCNTGIKSYDINGKLYQNWYYLSDYKYKFNSVGTTFYLGFNADANATVTLDIRPSDLAFKWEIYKIHNNSETLVREKSLSNEFNIYYDFKQNAEYKFICWINDSYKLNDYFRTGSTEGLSFNEMSGILKISSNCRLKSNVTIMATTINDNESVYKAGINVHILFTFDINMKVDYNNKIELSWDSIPKIEKYFFKLYTSASSTPVIMPAITNSSSFKYDFLPTFTNLTKVTSAYVELYRVDIGSDSYMLGKTDDVKCTSVLRCDLNCVYARKSGNIAYISNELHLYNIRYAEQSTPRALTNNIVLKKYSNWSPIATLNCNINGNNYSISGMNLSLPSNEFTVTQNRGFVGINNATISNLKISNATIRCAYNGNRGIINFGLIAGLNKGTITNCTVLGNFDFLRQESSIGGIAGENAAGATVSNCTYGDLNASKCSMVGSGDVGGIVGRNYGTVAGCKTVNVEIASYIINSAMSYGGIVGYCNNAIIKDCYVKNLRMGNVNPSEIKKYSPKMGCIVGHMVNGSKLSNFQRYDFSYYYGNINKYYRKFCFNGDWNYYGRIENSHVDDRYFADTNK